MIHMYMYIHAYVYIYIYIAPYSPANSFTLICTPQWALFQKKLKAAVHAQTSEGISM